MMQRTKGKVGEREISNILADLTGWAISRRVRQHDGDSDLIGIPGWSIEVKRHKTAGRGEIAYWWAQTVRQAQATGEIPVLAFRRDYDEWRMVWPCAVTLGVQTADMWVGYEWTCEGAPQAWAAVAREIGARRPQEAGDAPHRLDAPVAGSTARLSAISGVF